jgi:hypothetical protein
MNPERSLALALIGRASKVHVVDSQTIVEFTSTFVTASELSWHTSVGHGMTRRGDTA